jgi:hypothetical protein
VILPAVLTPRRIEVVALINRRSTTENCRNTRAHIEPTAGDYHRLAYLRTVVAGDLRDLPINESRIRQWPPGRIACRATIIKRHHSGRHGDPVGVLAEWDDLVGARSELPRVGRITPCWCSVSDENHAGTGADQIRAHEPSNGATDGAARHDGQDESPARSNELRDRHSKPLYARPLG